MPTLIIVGIGPGIGAAVARRFAREGYAVGAIARSQATLDSALGPVAELGAATAGARADAGDEHELAAALDELTGRLGTPDALVYNAGLIRADTIDELPTAEHQRSHAVNVVGAIHTAARLLPQVAQSGGGTYLLTGGMPTPVPDVTSLSLGKAGIRALAELLDAQFRAEGVHVATVTVAGTVAPGTPFDPDAIAERYWQLHVQPRGAWEREVLFAG